MKEKILVVDDEQTLREMMYHTLEDEHYEVLLAAGARDVMDILSAGQDITCVFLDLKLFGSNGIELCRAIRKRCPLSIIYAMTGWSGSSRLKSAVRRVLTITLPNR